MKEKMEEQIEKQEKFMLDEEIIQEEAFKEIPIENKQSITKQVKVQHKIDDITINCLRNEKIIVRHVPKEGGTITNPTHILYGGMSENAVRFFTVPQLSSGMFVNVLTDKEKSYLEEVMGLEYNALSIYKKVDNYWENFQVRLTKQDNYLDLSNPEDFIKYKVLLANKDMIAPTLDKLKNFPKATYQYVIINTGEELKSAKDTMSNTMQCYKEFGKVENDSDTLRVILEILDGRPLAINTKLEFLQTQINTNIQKDSKTFLQVITDSLLSTKVLIKKSIEAGLINSRGTFLYLNEGNIPLCEDNEEPTLNFAATYLNRAKHQSIKFMLESKLK